MLSATINLQSKVATTWQRALALGIKAPEVQDIAGRAGVGVVRRHLRKLDRERPNALGARRTHFYAKAAESTHFDRVTGGVQLTVSHEGIAQRRYGGRIEPSGRTSSVTGKPIQRLAIPAVAEAYNRNPADFQDLELIVFKRSKSAALARTGGQSGKDFRVYYWLVKSVKQDPDPGVMPSETAIAGSATGAINSYLNRIASRGVR